MMRRIAARGRRRDERGQMLIVIALMVVPLTFVLAAIVVDVSMWQSERRGAQKDADLASLAGAFELFDQSAGEAATIDAARDAVMDNADANDEAGTAGIIGDIQVDNTCFSGERLDSVVVDVSHQSETLFSEIFGIDLAPEIGAHARACMGSVVTTSGLRPYGVESEPVCLDDGTCEPTADSQCFELRDGIMVPRFGEWCQLDDGSLDPSTSLRGLLNLEREGDVCSRNGGGASEAGQNVLHGSGATCSVGDPVLPKPGGNVGQDTANIRQLLAGNGTPPVADGEDCDAQPWGDGDGFDQFDEVVQRTDGGSAPSPDAVFQVRACVSPRIIHVIVIDNFEADPPTIRAFAAFYVLGCKTDSQDLDVLPNRCASGPGGHLQLWGVFFNKVELEGDLGAFNPFGTHKISLVE
jgi:hypothetical protein